jgi:hypothetical protein
VSGNAGEADADIDRGVEESKHGETEPRSRRCNNTDTVDTVVASSTENSGTADTAAAADSDLSSDHNGSDAGSSIDKSDTASEVTDIATGGAGAHSEPPAATVATTAGISDNSSSSATTAGTAGDSTTSTTAVAAAASASSSTAAVADDIKLQQSIVAQATAASQLKKLIRLVLSTSDSAEDKVESINY